MKRCLVFKLALFLTLLGGGAIVNVAVAWGCATRSVQTMPLAIGPSPPVESRAPMKMPDREWRAWGLRRHGESETEFQTTVTRVPGEHGDFDSSFDVTVDGSLSWIIWTHEAGLPLFALSRREIVRNILGNPLLLAPPTEYRLTKPIWPGFAINTVFYAFILWLLFAAPFAVRRRRRIRRGLCPKCAYDLRGTPDGATACPECGHVVR